MIGATGQAATELSPVSLPKEALGLGKDGRPVLLGGRCKACKAVSFPKVDICPACLSEDTVTEEMPRAGRLYSFTTLYVGPAKMNKPLMLGYVDLPNGVRVFSHLSNGSRKLAIDQQVQLCVAAVGREADGRPIETFIFEPADGS